MTIIRSCVVAVVLLSIGFASPALAAAAEDPQSGANSVMYWANALRAKTTELGPS